MLQQGLYEQLINKLIAAKLDNLDKETYYIKESVLDKSEAGEFLSQYLSTIIKFTMESLPHEQGISRQIALANKIIKLLESELNNERFDDDLLHAKGRILKAVFSKIDAPFSNFDDYLKEITPYTRFSHSELFTGNSHGLSLESELKKEILSADQICFLVSFIRWSGIRIFERELREFTNRGGKLKVITTSYMGATDIKAVQFLSSLMNTEIKVSYNTEHERLHAKAYLFFRNTGFHTGYIGSSNLSRSALTNGLEWNIKVTTKEISHIIKKFQMTFDVYWQDKDFERFDWEKNHEKLRIALKNEKQISTSSATFFDINPFPFQAEILEKLQSERQVHNCYKNLIVAATGTGKTIISAFDFKRFRQSDNNVTILYVAHRKEILEQALFTYRQILKDSNFGDLWVDGIEPESYKHLFASVQTLNSRMDGLSLSEKFFDYIVIDEVHHITAESYRPILRRFKPKILLGLTATPERMDGDNILTDFAKRIAADIRLPEALNRKLLCPFQYFAVSDSVDLSQVSWVRGCYVPSELTRVYTKSDQRVGEILVNLDKYLNDPDDVRAIGFCVTQEHAQYMAEKFTLAGKKANYLTAQKTGERDELRRMLINKQINYLFVVDIFNEGLDIPEIDTVLFLRPTESLTIFLQQLGRGLRLAEGKECLTVLDFVGNSRPEYNFEQKFRAIVGKTNTPIDKEISDDFPHLPLGCSIVLEKRAKEIILENIKQAINFNINQLIAKIQNFQHQTNMELTLQNFSKFNNIPLQLIYKKGTWSKLCSIAGLLPEYDDTHEKAIARGIRKWLSCNSHSYFSFLLSLAKQNFNVQLDELTDEQKSFCLMLYFDIWETPKLFHSLQNAILEIGKNPILVKEIISVLEILLKNINYLELETSLPYNQPLKIHSRYNRNQILAAFGLNSYTKKSSFAIGVGVAENKKLNTELLFIDLIKSEEDYSPTTLYNDYAIDENLFHWQSQNSSRPDKGKGLSYINHKKLDKRILLFVREGKLDEFGFTMGYVFIGESTFRDSEGSKPMSITWQLHEPLPAYLLKDSLKLSAG